MNHNNFDTAAAENAQTVADQWSTLSSDGVFGFIFDLMGQFADIAEAAAKLIGLIA